MVSNTYIYILVDQLCDYLVNSSFEKGSSSFLWEGLTELGCDVMNEAWNEIKKQDKTLHRKDWVYFSDLPVEKLYEITHDAVKGF